MRKKLLIVIIVIPFLIILWGVYAFISGMSELAPNGTLPIKSYLYPVPYSQLAKATWTIIKTNSEIVPDTLNTVHAYRDYYNDSVNCITFHINASDSSFDEFTCQFYGDSTYRATSNTSEISIKFMSNSKLKQIAKTDENRLIRLFEKELIIKIDSLIAGKPIKH